MRPSFVFVGPSKAGSSWFFEILREHPEVFIPPNRATFFFCHHYEKGTPWYEGFFSSAGQRIVGEVCHDYLASPEALTRIQKYRPDMRLICCLRNPYERALSAWRFSGRNGMDQPTLVDQVAIDPGVFEQGNYATQLRYLGSMFPQNQILVFLFEELTADPASVARRLYNFIGVDTQFTPPSLFRRINVNADARWRQLARMVQYVHGLSWKGPRILSNLVGHTKRFRALRQLVRIALYKEHQHSQDWRQHLSEFPSPIISRYEREIEALERMLAKDLANWHAPIYQQKAKGSDNHCVDKSELIG